jgi:hypothetical protein
VKERVVFRILLEEVEAEEAIKIKREIEKLIEKIERKELEMTFLPTPPLPPR